MEDGTEVDAYSIWRKNRPCVFLNTGKSAERRRFDAAHELGHLVLHKHAAPSGIDAEKDANAFASAFLMPAASLRAIGRVVSLDYLVEQKKKWCVSVAAMAYRLHSLRLMSDWNYHMLCVEMSKRGYRKKEPLEAKPEISQVWQKVFANLRVSGQSVQFLADRLLVPAEELVKLVFGLVTVGLPATATTPVSSRPRVHLRLVT